MTLEEFENELRQLGDSMQGLDLVITQYLTQRVAELQNRAPRDTGDLANSIKLMADRWSFQIQMNYYGVFQNYGVAGTKSSRIPVNLPEAGLSIGEEAIRQERFQFGTGNFDNNGRPWGAYYTGLRAQAFFSISELTNELENIIKNNI